MKINQLVRNLFFEIWHGFKGFPMVVNDQFLRVDVSLRRWNVNSELEMLKTFQKYLKPGDILIDIGANFGLHTLYAAKLLKNQGHVFAFEPVASNLNLLEKHIALNDLNGSVTVVPKAVSNSQEKFTSFYLSSEEMTVTASLNQTEENLLKIEVENTRLDDYWESIDLPIKLIKVDVEGAELEVLRGAEKVLKKWHPILVIEVHGFALPDFGSTIQDLTHFLMNLGYQETKLETDQFYRDDYFQAVYTIA
jgi:FkbM family methyltransferase